MCQGENLFSPQPYIHSILHGNQRLPYSYLIAECLHKYQRGTHCLLSYVESLMYLCTSVSYNLMILSCLARLLAALYLCLNIKRKTRILQRLPNFYLNSRKLQNYIQIACCLMLKILCTFNFVEPAFARCKSSSKLGFCSLTRSFVLLSHIIS